MLDWYFDIFIKNIDDYLVTNYDSYTSAGIHTYQWVSRGIQEYLHQFSPVSKSI